MSSYSVSISRYLTKKDRNGYRYRINYSYISPIDCKLHRSSKGGFKLYKDARRWLETEYKQFLENREQYREVQNNE